jgi:hypothetical protein
MSTPEQQKEPAAILDAMASNAALLRVELNQEKRAHATTKKMFLELDTVYTNTILDRDRAWKRVQQLEALNKTFAKKIEELEAQNEREQTS